MFRRWSQSSLGAAARRAPEPAGGQTDRLLRGERLSGHNGQTVLRYMPVRPDRAAASAPA